VKKTVLALVAFFITTITPATFAATTVVEDYSGIAYKYANTDSSFLAQADPIDAAYYWSGSNISGDDAPTFTSDLNDFFNSSDTKVGAFDIDYTGFTFSFNTAVKTDGSGYENPIDAKIKGVLLKQSTNSLLITFTDFTGPLYWNTLFATNKNDKITGSLTGTDAISHYVLLDVAAVPLPAALWLFAPALIGLMGLRRKAGSTAA